MRTATLVTPHSQFMEQLTANLQHKIRLEKKQLSILEQAFQTTTFSKGDSLLKTGQYCRTLYYLESGTVRSFFLNDGKDITSWIYREDQFFTAWYSFLNQESSFENIEALETSVVQYISHENLQQLYKSDPAFEKIGRLIVEEQFAFLDLYSKGYSFMTAKEKYDLFLSYFPDITLRVNLGHLASLLGISQETLSRIRKKK
ncbi:MAG: Crp/Fnr family transcriptional regulator [Bacteroidota bacterium]